MPSECCGIRLESADSRTSFGISNFSALSVETTYVYLHADLELKERAMARTSPCRDPNEKVRASGQCPGVPEQLVIIPAFWRSMARDPPAPERRFRNNPGSGITEASAISAWPRSNRRSPGASVPYSSHRHIVESRATSRPWRHSDTTPWSLSPSPCREGPSTASTKTPNKQSNHRVSSYPASCITLRCNLHTPRIPRHRFVLRIQSPSRYMGQHEWRLSGVRIIFTLVRQTHTCRTVRIALYPRNGRALSQEIYAPFGCSFITHGMVNSPSAGRRHNDRAQPRRVSGVGWSDWLGDLFALAPTSNPTTTEPIFPQPLQSTALFYLSFFIDRAPIKIRCFILTHASDAVPRHAVLGSGCPMR